MSSSAISSPIRSEALWIHSPRWDSFWILSGFWLPLLFLILPLQSARPLILGLTLALWIAHRLSSLYLALCVAEYRPVLQARKGYFFGLPLLLLGALLLWLLCPVSLLPLPRLERILLLGLGDYFFSLYHFAVQHYGVLSVYRSRLPHGQARPEQLKWDWWLCLGVSGGLSLVMDYLHGDLQELHFFSTQPFIPFFGPWSDGQMLLLQLILSLLLLGLWGLNLRRYQRQNQGLARMLYMSALCFMTLASLYLDPLLYFALAQIQHWLVSLGLIGMMAHRSEGTAMAVIESQWKRGWYGFWAWFNARAWGPLLVLVLLSLLLTPILEADYFISRGFSNDAVVVQGFLEPFRHSLWLWGFGALAFFSSFTHYLYDRGVFRFSDPLTRQAALKLLR